MFKYSSILKAYHEMLRKKYGPLVAKRSVRRKMSFFAVYFKLQMNRRSCKLCSYCIRKSKNFSLNWCKIHHWRPYHSTAKFGQSLLFFLSLQAKSKKCTMVGAIWSGITLYRASGLILFHLHYIEERICYLLIYILWNWPLSSRRLFSKRIFLSINSSRVH